MSEAIHKSHNVSKLMYHFVLPTKYRRVVVSEEVEDVIKEGVSQYLCWYCIITSPVGSCAHPLHCANSKFAQWNSRLQTVCPSCRLRNERRWKIMHYSD